MRCNGDFSWWLLVFLTYPRSFSVRVSRCFGLPSCLLVTLLLAAFKMQMLWGHCIWATVHNPVAFHLLAKAVIVVSLVCLWALLSFSVSSMIQSVLTVAVYCQSGFTGEKHVLTSPLDPLVRPFPFWRIKSKGASKVRLPLSVVCLQQCHIVLSAAQRW